MKIVPASVPKQLPPARKRAVRQPQDVIAECSCCVVPVPVLRELGGIKGVLVLCYEHGWQQPVRTATLQERAGFGPPLPFPDEPPF